MDTKNIQTLTLENGLTVVHIHTPGSKTLALNLRGLGGSMHENKDETGAAHFLEHVVFDGTEKYPNHKTLSEVLGKIGGASGASTNDVSVIYRVSVLAEDIETGFDYLSQVVLHPLISDEAVEKHREIIVQEIEERMANNRAYAYHKLHGLLYPSDRIGTIVPGTVSHVKKLQKESILSFKQRTYVAKNFVLAICGDVPFSQAQELANKYFANMESGVRQEVRDIARNDDFQCHIETRRDTQQTAIQLGWHAYTSQDKEKYASFMCSELLGGGSLSRLNQKVREQLGLVYDINAEASAGFGFGVFYVDTAVAPQNIEQVLTAIYEEIKILQSKLSDESELQNIKHDFKAGFLFGFEKVATIASYYSDLYLYDAPKIKTHEEIQNIYESLSPKDIQNVAQYIFSKPPKVTIISPEANVVSVKKIERILNT